MRAPQKFQRLFKKASTGKIVQWDIVVRDPMSDQSVGEIETTWGEVGGSLQSTTDLVKTGKNLGKKNATNPFTQALADAKGKWEKQKKKGYVEKYADAEKGKVDKTVITGGISPMLAHKYSEHGHKIVWPAWAQPKLDGHRCIGIVENGKASLWSRTRKPITGVPHIEDALLRMGPSAGGRMVVDGELYNHDYKDRFEELTSFIRQVTPKPGHEVVQYHLYDYLESDQHGQTTPFSERTRLLEADITGRAPNDGRIHYVETVRVEDEDELMVSFEDFLKQGYEGAIVRNAGGLYVNKRSYDLLKVKEFEDAEFRIVGVEEGRGKLAGHAIFVCQGKGGEFRAKMKGPQADLKKYFEQADEYVGQQLTVKYQGLTKSDVPRFPVAWRIRKDAA